MGKKAKKYKSDHEWDELIQLVPGYDPTKDAEDYYFDPKAADRVVEFIESYCRHVDGPIAGTPILLEDWQKGIVGNIFGWKKKVDGFRRYTSALLFLPRKNGKTVLSACIALYMLLLDGERSPNIQCAAGNKEQASNIYRMCKNMIQLDTELAERTKIFTSTRLITAPEIFGRLEPRSKESGTAHGLNVSLAILDELHIWKSNALAEALESSQGVRNQPLILMTTTADYGGKESLCNVKLKYYQGVLNGTIDDPTALPVIYAKAPDEDWQDEAVWHRVNPNLGISIKLDRFRRDFEKAKLSKTAEITCRRLHLNESVGAAQMFFDLDQWQACGDLKLDIEDLKGEECYLAFDLSTTKDLSAVASYFPDYNAIFVQCFCPEEGIRERSKTDGVQYDNYVAHGSLTPTPGNVVDYKYMYEWITSFAEDYAVQAIGFDPWHAQELNRLLDEAGFDMVKIKQIMGTMYPALQIFERDVMSAKIKHDNNSLLTWNVTNMVVEITASGFYKPDKSKSAEKIDAIVACIMARYLAEVYRPDTTPESIYETRAPLVFGGLG